MKKNTKLILLSVIIILSIIGLGYLFISQSIVFGANQMDCSLGGAKVTCIMEGSSGIGSKLDVWGNDIHININKPSRGDEYAQGLIGTGIATSSKFENFFSLHQRNSPYNSKMFFLPNDYNSLPTQWTSDFIGDHGTEGISVNIRRFFQVVMGNSSMTGDGEIYPSREAISTGIPEETIKIVGLCDLAYGDCVIKNDPYPGSEKWIVLKNIEIVSREGGYSQEDILSSQQEPSPVDNEVDEEPKSTNNPAQETTQPNKTSIPSWVYLIPLIFIILLVVLIYSVIKKTIKRRK